jgi:hypothetical protein
MGLAQSTQNYAKTLSKLLVTTTIQDGQGMRIHYTILTGIISKITRVKKSGHQPHSTGDKFPIAAKVKVRTQFHNDRRTI